MGFAAFSPKQMQALTWWCPGSDERDRDAIICDGAVRSGKTLCLSLSFVLWAMFTFRGRSFGLCGKTIVSLRRNLVTPLLPALCELGLRCRHRISTGTVEVELGDSCNRFYLFGGRDEGSAALIQGITLAGILLDEVALMPRSFVEQGLARCSVEGSRFWFNCNPEHPGHWFYTEWIRRCKEKNALYLHFVMEDNPSLSPPVLERYRSLYSGVFHQRYVLGRWVAAQGLIYPMFSPRRHVVDEVPGCGRFVVSCDYGTVNPASFGLWGQCGETWYRIREYYYDSRREGAQLTDGEYADALERLAEDLPVELAIVDPSAASFIQCLRRRGRIPVRAAENRVRDGIRLVAGMLGQGSLLVHSSCKDTLREFSLYRWDSAGEGETPRKEHDHAMDDIRYFAAWVNREPGDGFFAMSAGRG